MRPLDRRLLRLARTARFRLALAAAASTLDAVLLVAAAAVLASTVAAVVGDGTVAIVDDVALLLGILTARGVLGAVSTTLPQQAAAAIKLALRRDILAATVRRGSTRARTGEVTAVAGRGLDALDPYFARYVPELIKGAAVPIAVLIALLASDLTAGLIVAATLPLIPLFGAFVGAYTSRRTQRQWRTLEVLSHHFLDVVSGLPTLKVFGRAEAQAATIARVTERHRRATMSTLRIALLSALVLELAATMSVALVAVSVGLRLVDGGLDLQLALFLLILAPEASLPLRRAAAEYHAAAEGVAAAERAFALIDADPLPDAAERPTSELGDSVTLAVDAVTVSFPDRDRPALDHFTGAFFPGTTTVVIGPSGSGKSTLLRAMLGLCTIDAGTVTINGRDLNTIDADTLHRRVAWLPQHPQFVTASVADNIALGRGGSTMDEIRRAALRSGAAEFVNDLADGYATVLPESGAGLSLGQRQRIALARMFLRTDASVLLLDEPTAHLDAVSERAVVAAIREFATSRTAVIVTHRPALLPLADEVVDLTREVVS